MKKYLKWYLLACLALAVVLVSAKPWNWTNASADETIPIVVTKVWDDMDNADGSRPASVTMQINQNGALWRTVELTAADGTGSQWTKEITDAPLRDAAGNKYEYTLAEVIPEGYTADIQKTEPEDVTQFAASIAPSVENPYEGDEFQYVVTVANSSTYDGLLTMTATLDNRVTISGATDGGTINGNTVGWSGVVIPNNGTKVFYITVTAREEGSYRAELQASINGRSTDNGYSHEVQNVPEIKAFRMTASGSPDSVTAGESATVTWDLAVRGDTGARYTVRLGDSNTSVISGSLSGTIGTGGENTIRLSKTMATSSGQTGVNISCSATIQASGKTKLAQGLNATATGSVSITVTEPVPEMLSATWVDEDRITILDGPKTFAKGSVVPSTSVVPTKSDDEDNTYTFREWLRFEDASGNITFQAVYTATPKPPGPVDYTVNWYYDGILFKSETRTGVVGEFVEATAADISKNTYVFLESRSTPFVTLTKSGGTIDLYFMKCFKVSCKPNGYTEITDGKIVTFETVFTNIGSIDVYDISTKAVMEPSDGITFVMGNYTANGTPLTPVSGGINDLTHELKLLPDGAALSPGETITLSFTVSVTGKTSGVNIAPTFYSMGHELPRTGIMMMALDDEPMTRSAEREPIRFLVTNSHTPAAKTSVTVGINWNDSNNKSGRRPASVDVQLMQDGNLLKTITLNSASGWRATEEGLLANAPDGHGYQYAVQQASLPEGYETSVSTVGQVTTFTNTYREEYTVAYDLNGGTLNNGAPGFTYSGGTYSKTVRDGDMFPALGQTPVKAHASFNGWSPALPSTVTQSATYRAVWITNTHTITYTDGAGGSAFANYTADAEYGAATPDYPGVPEREGYIFKGWDPEKAATVSGDATYTAKWETKPADVHVHTKGSDKVIKAPTCTEAGTSASVCSGCGETYGEYIVAALGHTRGEEVIQKQPTCTEAGRKAYTCGRCGTVYGEEEIPALGHLDSLSYADNGDGTHSGTCGRCNVKTVNEAHKWGEWSEAAGKLRRGCTLCSAVEEQDMPAKTYTVTYSANDSISTRLYEEGTKILVEEGPGNEDGHFAGWTWDGREYHAGDTVTVDRNIAFTLKVEAHAFADRSQAGTCTETGYSWKECTVCGYETARTETGKGAHQPSAAWTDCCTSHADEACGGHVRMCTACNKPVESGEHSYGEWTVKTENGYTLMERTCSCGHKETAKAQLSVETVYNGKARPLTSTSDYEGIQGNVRGLNVEFSYKDESGALMDGDPKDAGSYTAVVRLSTGNTEIGSAEIAYTIRPAVLTAKYKGETIPVNGSFKGTVEVDGFMHGDTDMPDFEFPEIDVSGIDWGKPGTYIIKPYGGRVNGNYVFEYVEGTLSIVLDTSASVMYPVLEEDPGKPLIEKADILEQDTKVIVSLDGGKWEPEAEDGFWTKGINGRYEHVLETGDRATLYSNPTKEGYLFMGWKKAASGSNVTFTAHWGEVAAGVDGVLAYNSKAQAPKVAVDIHGSALKEDQFEVTEYRVKGGESLGADGQGNPVLPKDAGTYEAQTAVRDALGAPVCVVYAEFTIKPAKLTVKTESARKEYDGKELTAGGTMEGLMEGDKAELKVTGTRTEKGSSVNTYVIEWGDTKASNYKVIENLGTLTVGEESSILDIRASIEWSDVDNYDKLRPERLEVVLYRGGKVYQRGTADADTGWACSFKADKADEEGKAYEYTVSVKAPKGYKASADGYKVTLTHVPVTSMGIKVSWNDKNNKDGVRPDEVNLVIYQNGKEFRTVTVYKKNSWKLSVKDLPKFDENHKEYAYALSCDKEPSSYTAAVKGTSVTFTHVAKSSADTSTKPNSSGTTKPNSSSTTKPNSSDIMKPGTGDGKGEVVKTGENDFLLFSLIGLTALAGAGFAAYKKRRGRK